jgi:hypothetical protein
MAQREVVNGILLNPQAICLTNKDQFLKSALQYYFSPYAAGHTVKHQRYPLDAIGFLDPGYPLRHFRDDTVGCSANRPTWSL